MGDLEDKISKERSRYKKIELGTLGGGILLIAMGIVLLTIIPESTWLAHTVTTALYFGIGASLIVKSLTIKRDLERSINEIKMDEKLDKIISIITEKEILTKKEQRRKNKTIRE